MGLREIGCEGGKCLKLARDRVQLRALEVEVLNTRFLLPELTAKYDSDNINIKMLRNSIQQSSNCNTFLFRSEYD
jgi:hypothetical protein